MIPVLTAVFKPRRWAGAVSPQAGGEAWQGKTSAYTYIWTPCPYYGRKVLAVVRFCVPA